jgi:drug/metabolite transporter (DMT)-like permease
MRNRYIYLELTLSALFWGLSFNVAKLIVGAWPPITASAYRLLVAAVLLLVIAPFVDRDWIQRLRQNWFAYCCMGVAGVGFNILFFFGLEHTSSTNGALIMATNPLVVALISAIILNETISDNHKVGTLVSFIGVIVLIMTGARDRVVGANIGDLMVIGGNICIALYSVINKHAVRNSPPLTTTTLATFFGAAIICVAASIFDGWPRQDNASFGAWAGVVFLGAFGSVLAYIFWNRGIRAIGVADTAIFFHLVPLFTVLGSFAFGQTVTPMQLGAGAIVIFGVMISSGTAAGGAFVVDFIAQRRRALSLGSASIKSNARKES